jgi:hypothetical protein
MKFLILALLLNGYLTVRNKVLKNFFFSGIGVGTQDLVLTRQAFYYLKHIPSPFCFSYFSDRVLHFLPKPALDQDPPVSST